MLYDPAEEDDELELESDQISIVRMNFARLPELEVAVWVGGGRKRAAAAALR